METLTRTTTPENTGQFRYTVVGDTHGHYETVARMVEAEDPRTDVFVFAGDMVDGRDPYGAKRLIGLINELGERAVTIAGNHDWILRNALQAVEFNGEISAGLREGLLTRWKNMHQNVLQSYGVTPRPNWARNARNLASAMEEEGHYQWLNSLPLTFETDDFIVVHAGPKLDQNWKDQVSKINRQTSTKIEALEAEPEQVFSLELAKMCRIDPGIVDGRPFLHGHRHFQKKYKGPRDASVALGRVWLGSKINEFEPLYTWNSEERTVTAHENKGISTNRRRTGKITIEHQLAQAA